MNHADHLPLHTLSIEPWGLSELSYLPDQAPHESLLTLGNGRIGVRGAHEEGAVWSGTFQNDVFINGFTNPNRLSIPNLLTVLPRPINSWCAYPTQHRSLSTLMAKHLIQN